MSMVGVRSDKGARTRATLLKSATTRFVSSGFQRTTMADVARDAGMTPSAVYRYFPDKEALYIAAVDQDAGALIDLVRRTLFEGQETTIEGLLIRVLSELSLAVEAHPLAARSIRGTDALNPESIMALPRLGELRQELTDLLELGQSIGLIRPDLLASKLALGIETIVLYQLAYLASLRSGRPKVDGERWGALATMIDAALRPCPDQVSS
jgi:AcrR family transcriptional regulator